MGKLVFEREEAIAIVTINRPEILNAIDTETTRELREAMARIESDDGIRVAIITGAGDKSFCVGADIKEMKREEERRDTYLDVAERGFPYVANLGKPIIAAVNGYALGGGCELALACDLIIASRDAKFGQPEINLGHIPGAGGTQRLPCLVGKLKAKELIFTGEMIGAEEAERIGLVNRFVEPGELMEVAKDLARKIAEKAPIALRLAKSAIDKGANMSLEEGIAYEGTCCSLCFATEDHREGVAAFAEKRKPVFKGK